MELWSNSLRPAAKNEEGERDRHDGTCWCCKVMCLINLRTTVTDVQQNWLELNDFKKYRYTGEVLGDYSNLARSKTASGDRTEKRTSGVPI